MKYPSAASLKHRRGRATRDDGTPKVQLMVSGIPVDQFDRLRIYAAANGLNVSQLFREAVREKLDREAAE
jgi:hypothetical protein